MSSAPLLCRVAVKATRASGPNVLNCNAWHFCPRRHLWRKADSSIRPLLSTQKARDATVVSRDFWRSGRVRWLSDDGKEKKSSSQTQNTPKPDLSSSPPTKTTTKLLDRVKSLTPHENIYTIPNILTFSRLAAAPVIGYLVLHDYHAWAVGLFAYAGITDLVDGWIARRFKQQTVVGTVIDPMADKTLMTVLTVALAVKGALPAWCAIIIIGRDVGLAISAIYYRYISLPPPKTFARYWDFSLPSAEVHPTGISKINTALQLGLIGWTVCMPMLTGFGPGMQTALTGMQYLVATTTIWSGLSYVYTKDAVKILSQEDIEERRRKAEGKE